jgi:hypothetical protein
MVMIGKKKNDTFHCGVMVGAKDGGLLKCVPCGFEIGGNGWDWFKWLCIRVGKMETNVWQRKRNGV